MTSKSTVVRLPAGLVGNPNGPGKCSVAQLNADTCPAASKIGTVSSSARQDTLPLLPPVTSTGDVYNVTPTGNEPARVENDHPAARRRLGQDLHVGARSRSAAR